MDFSEQGECEKCRGFTKISKTGICENCFDDIIACRNNPALLKSRLGKLNQAEAGVRSSIRRQTAIATHQNNSPQILTTEKLASTAAAQREDFKNRKPEKNFEKWFEATPDELAATRDVAPFRISLEEVSAELISYLATKPEDFVRLHPRKFEEVVCEIYKDQGHDVILTEPGNDGGRDVLVTVNSAVGSFFTIVECKRWDRAGNIPKSIVERFVFTIREQDKANMGILVATTDFASGGKKVANQYEHLLKLANLDILTQMASRFGSWGKAGDSEIWMPDY